MASGISIDIKLLGDKSLSRTFSRLPGAVQKKLLRKGLRAGAKIVLARARILAGRISKQLGRLLKVRALKRSRRRMGVLVVAPTKAKLGIPEDAKGYWPAHIEFGFRHTSGKQVPARPYLRPAADQTKEAAFKAIGDSLREAVDQEWRKK